MVRSRKDAKLDTRSNRLKLVIRKEPYWASLSPGEALGYFRPASGGAGTWWAKHRDTESGNRRKSRLAVADDYAEADGAKVLTYAQAQVMARVWFDQAHQDATGEKIQRGPFTVAQAMEAYLDHMDQAGKKSAKDARARTGLHILPALGSAEVGKLNRLRLEKWRDALAASPRTRKMSHRPKPKNPRKPVKEAVALPPPKSADEKRARKATANRVLSTLKAALSYAKQRGLVRCSDDAWRSTKPFRAVDEARQNYMTPEEQQRLLNAIKDPGFKRLVCGALLTGCRYGELARMKVRDFDSTSSTVLLLETKGGKPRRARLTVEGNAYFLSITAGRLGTEALFQRDEVKRRTRTKEEDHLAWGPSEQGRLMRAACEAAKLPRMGFHQLRHSYASALVSAGMTLSVLAKLTGHVDTRMLEKHYAHLAQSDVTRSLEALAPKLGASMAPVVTLKINLVGA